jgi:glutathione S-transferase
VVVSAETATDADLKSISPLAKALVVTYQGQPVATVNAILRLIASLAPASKLLGVSDMDDALIDGWLSYIWSSVDLPLAAAGENEAVQKELKGALDTIEAHLAKNSYMVGDGVSLADISLAVSLQEANYKCDDGSKLLAWYTKVTTVLGNTAPASTSAPVAAASSASSEGVMLNGPPPAVVSSLYRRNRIRIKEVLKNESTFMNQSITVGGWARTTRNANKGQLLFIELSDGSCGTGLQCVLDSTTTEGFEECKNSGGTGASFQLIGTIVPSQGEGQALEMQVKTGKLLGAVYGGNVEGTEIGGKLYPIGKKAHTLEHMRENAHLRPRTKVHAAAMRIRHAMAYATHTFFHNHGFLYIHTPIITGADCEGAGEQFCVTTLLGSDHLAPGVELPKHEPPPVSIALMMYGTLLVDAL